MSTGADDYLDYLDSHKTERQHVEFAVLNLICFLGISAGFPVTVTDLYKAIGKHDSPEPVLGKRGRLRKGAKRGRSLGESKVKGQWTT
jgi:hypothetical protein